MSSSASSTGRNGSKSCCSANPHPTLGRGRAGSSTPLPSAATTCTGVAQALYGQQPDVQLADKPAVLRRLQADGLWLIDATDQPVNHLPSTARRAAIQAAVPQLVDRCCDLAPRRGVVICHNIVYQLAAPALRDAGVTVLHDQPLPFPLGNWRAEFVAGLRRALT
jgi:hypothetical protein